jgi:hypothetical protein
MPMDFKDLESLVRAAKCHHFRDKKKEETEKEYRTALADHVAPRDFIESEEIRNGIGWDKWNDTQKDFMLLRKFLS